MKLPLGVLVSGNGTNLQSIIDNTQSGKIGAEVKIVISDNKEALALKRAQKAKIPTAVCLREDFSSKEEFESKIVSILEKHHVKLVCLAGFMRLLGETFLKAWPGKIMNIHPTLLPSFPGLHPQKQALEYGVKVSGCTVHFVDEGADTGPIVLQSAVPVLPDDTEENLRNRILKEEHRIYSEAIQLFAEGRLVIRGRHVIIKDSHRRKS